MLAMAGGVGCNAILGIGDPYVIDNDSGKPPATTGISAGSNVGGADPSGTSSRMDSEKLPGYLGPMSLFPAFWANHPARQSPPVIEPCTGRTYFENQCVIRLGLAMTRSGVSLASYRGAFCWNGHGSSHPLRVEEMKLWLNSESANFVPYAQKSKRTAKGVQNTFRAYLGQRGIVAFLDFWGPSNTGDHIDLWNGSEIAHGDLDYFERSREIWFWKMT